MHDPFLDSDHHSYGEEAMHQDHDHNLPEEHASSLHEHEHDLHTLGNSLSPSYGHHEHTQPVLADIVHTLHMKSLDDTLHALQNYLDFKHMLHQDPQHADSILQMHHSDIQHSLLERLGPLDRILIILQEPHESDRSH